jgi:hypothetical protein
LYAAEGMWNAPWSQVRNEAARPIDSLTTAQPRPYPTCLTGIRRPFSSWVSDETPTGGTSGIVNDREATILSKLQVRDMTNVAYSARRGTPIPINSTQLIVTLGAQLVSGIHKSRRRRHAIGIHLAK